MADSVSTSNSARITGVPLVRPTRRHPVDRRYFIGGSDARVIMGNDETALTRLWREKRGEVEPEDLSSNLVVQLGLVTEELNRRWYEKEAGIMVERLPNVSLLIRRHGGNMTRGKSMVELNVLRVFKKALDRQRGQGQNSP